MCLDPRPDRLVRNARAARRLTPRTDARPSGRSGRSLPLPSSVRPPALWAIEALAGDDDLVARGWVVVSREA